MSGLKNTMKRLASASVGRGYMTGRERRAKSAAKEQARLDKVYSGAQIPDEEEIARNERRKAARRRGSRVSTILTSDEETLG